MQADREIGDLCCRLQKENFTTYFLLRMAKLILVNPRYFGFVDAGSCEPPCNQSCHFVIVLWCELFKGGVIVVWHIQHSLNSKLLLDS